MAVLLQNWLSPTVLTNAATHDGVDYAAGTATWVDGGLLSNFPVEVFDRSDGQPARWPTPGHHQLRCLAGDLA